MIVFTIIGILLFWMLCWQVGYHYAMYLDAKAGFDKLMAPVESELTALVRMLNAINAKEADRG